MDDFLECFSGENSHFFIKQKHVYYNIPYRLILKRNYEAFDSDHCSQNYIKVIQTGITDQQILTLSHLLWLELIKVF